MRLHRLRMEGIGPFRDPVDLDFAALGASGLFLLEGPTGSGKSTILDAIVYALYGNVAGAGVSNDRIRSQFAAPETPSVVDLIFETGAGIFRVRREPGYERPKRRGSGTTTQHPHAVLWRLGSPGAIDLVVADGPGQADALEPIASRVPEVGAEITRALGLTRAQFTQTVLLPQGEFARFLRARTAERQEVLMRVFGTEIYDDIEKELVSRRRGAKERTAAAATALGEAAARVGEAAALEPDPLAELTTGVQDLRLDDVSAQGAQIRAAAEGARQVAQAVADTAQADHTAARTRADQALAVQRRHERRLQLDRLAARLAEQEPAARDARTRLERHERAAPVAEAATRLDQASARARTQIDALEAAIAAAREDEHLTDLADLAHVADHAQRDAALEELAAASDADTTRVGELAALVRREQELDGRREQLAQEAEQLAEERTRVEQLAESLASRPAERARLLAQRDAEKEKAATLGDARLAATAAVERLAAARSAQELSQRAETARAAAAAALERAVEAAQLEKALRDRRSAGLAAELALELAPGEPCAVCGALEHPAPARTEPDHVDRARVDQAETARRSADEQAAERRAEHEAACARRDAALEASEGITIAEAQTARDAAETAVQAAAEHAAQVENLEAQLAEHDRIGEEIRERHHRMASDLEVRASALATARESWDADAAAVTTARGDHPSVADRREHHRRRAQQADVLREHLAAVGEADERRGEAEAELAERLAVAEGLNTVEDARAAVLERGARTELEKLLQERAIDSSRLADGLAEDGIAQITSAQADLEHVTDAAREAAEAVTAAQERDRLAGADAAQARTRAERTESAVAALDAAIERVRAVGREAQAIIRVADLATGATADGERITLSTFVLMRRFEDVIAAANARLAMLSGSDLELVRDGGPRGARRTGLDLLVIDRRTDTRRVPETLSGGETFFVSLALALGLADIVTAEAGGVMMETLFIDEGFGSLDPERLDAVIEEITHLAEAGRTVGIVSHVAELKTRIPEQIHVSRRPDRTSQVTVTA